MQIEIVLPPSSPSGSIPSLHFGEALLSSFPLSLSSHVVAMGGRRMDRIADGESAFKPLSLLLDMFAFRRRSEPVGISVGKRYGTQSNRLPQDKQPGLHTIA